MSSDVPAFHLTDGVVSLRYYLPDDVDAVYDAVDESRAEIGRWMGWCHPGYSRADTEQWVAAQPQMRDSGDHPLLILDTPTGKVLGSSGLNAINTVHRFANLGYWVRTSAAGRGVATRAARLVAIAGLSALGLSRIEIVTDVANLSSARVAEKLGAVRESVARSRLRHDGVSHDAFMFSLVTSDLERLIADARAAGRHEPRIDLVGDLAD